MWKKKHFYHIDKTINELGWDSLMAAKLNLGLSLLGVCNDLGASCWVLLSNVWIWSKQIEIICSSFGYTERICCSHILLFCRASTRTTLICLHNSFLWAWIIMPIPTKCSFLTHTYHVEGVVTVGLEGNISKNQKIHPFNLAKIMNYSISPVKRSSLPYVEQADLKTAFNHC